jgi:hypothetical protein
MGFEPLIDLHEVKALSGNARQHEVAAFKVVGYTAHHPNEAKLKVQEWVRNLEAAPRSKGHIKAVIHRLCQAMHWARVEWKPLRTKLAGIGRRQD